MKKQQTENIIFNNLSDVKFNDFALELFKHQAENCMVYKTYLQNLKISPDNINSLNEILFLPVSFFKTEKIVTENFHPEIVFTSSSTTGTGESRHYIKKLNLYEQSFLNTFNMFYGNPFDYNVLALLPSYKEREGSSLIYMVDKIVSLSKKENSGYYLYNHNELYEKLCMLETNNEKSLLIGVSFSLLDFAENYKLSTRNTIFMETGGMKGRRKEITRNELHAKLCNSFGVSKIHSEYGMTELLSQAYSKGDGKFYTPPWMKIIIREITDPFSICKPGNLGCINVIDLANLYSCSFIATDDIGRINEDGSFEVLGRAEGSDLRGCSLLFI